MGIKDIFKGGKKESYTLSDLMVAALEQNRFVMDIYKEEVMTPHQEMKRCKQAYNTNSLIHAAVNTMLDFILGDEQKVISSDKMTEKSMNDYIQKIKLKRYLRELIENLIVTGNAYLEVSRDLMTKRIVEVYPITDSSRIYIKYDEQGNIISYIQEIDRMFKHPKAQTHTIQYPGSRIKTQIYGIEIPADKIIHFKLGMGDISLYGRSPIAATLNDLKILKELERAFAIIARFKAVPKKLISLKDATKADINEFAKYLNDLSDFENPITNREIDIKDISYAGQVDTTLFSMIDYLKRKSTIAMSPEFIIHGEETNRATSKEQLHGFILRIKAIREQIARTIEEQILIPAARTLGLSTDLSFEFGDLEYIEKETKITIAKDLWQSGVITLNEARRLAGLPEEEGGDIYYWELQQQTQQTEESLKKKTTLEERKSIADRISKLIERKRYFGIKVLERQYYKLLKDMIDEHDIKKAIKQADIEQALKQILREGYTEEAIAFLQSYFDKLTEKLKGKIERIYKIIAKAYTRGSKRVITVEGKTIRLGVVPDENAIKALTVEQLKYITKMSQDSKKKVMQILQKAIQEGWTTQQTTEEIVKKVSNLTKNRAKVIARTELVKAHNRGMEQAFKEAGVKKVRWVAAMDDRTCEVCRGYHNKVFTLSPTMPRPVINTHPNCRCVLVKEE